MFLHVLRSQRTLRVNNEEVLQLAILIFSSYIIGPKHTVPEQMRQVTYGFRCCRAVRERRTGLHNQAQRGLHLLIN